ncbi:LysE family translocator [Thalassospira sp.]|uniref:LysE family translocator n=1 Tax=Thalassospira sp. TaxID=1912094 RepID=UPI0027354586|nr:LysE family translocator [Thalassospira sp.]MDP2697620.1 LysE family translocator [Thalassospira sp.]
MTTTLFLSMAAFALAASISPGPVNIVALASGVQHGFRPSLRHVTGATIGFCLLLLLIGLGLNEILIQWPHLTRVIQWAGVGFLLYMAWKLARDNGEFGRKDGVHTPSALNGAIMQWLNPKAWLASIAGMGAYVADGDPVLVWQFAALYFVICYGSVACWAGIGAFLQHALNEPRRIRLFNRVMAALLIASAVYLILG